MLGFDGQTFVTATIAADALISNQIEVTGWNHVAFDVPLFSSFCVSATANVYVMGAAASSGTFRRIKDIGEYSAGAGIRDWEVPESTGSYIVACRPAARFNYIKVECSKTATAAISVNVILHK